MTDKQIDLLTSVAFDEGSYGEDIEIEAALAEDPELRAMFNEMKGLKSDLATLRDIPECQLSKERMRNAIFAAKAPKAQFSIFNWAIAGVAAASILFAMISLRFAPEAIPDIEDGAPAAVAQVAAPEKAEVVATKPSTEGKLIAQVTEEPRSLVSKLVLATPRRAVSTEDSEAPVAPSRKMASAARVSAPVAILAAPPGVVASAVVSESSTPSVGDSNDPAAGVMASLNEPSDDVILVSDLNDPDTGAAIAVEETVSSGIEFSG